MHVEYLSTIQQILITMTINNIDTNYLVNLVGEHGMKILLDPMSKPLTDRKYKALKDLLIATLGLSRRERASRLLHFCKLGDTKPSNLMDKMLALLRDNPLCLLFEQLF